METLAHDQVSQASFQIRMGTGRIFIVPSVKIYGANNVEQKCSQRYEY